jgi:hypothetical protein
VTDATLGVIGFVLVFYTQLHWMRAPFALIPLSLKSLFGTLLLPVVHQVARSRSSQ